MRAGIVLFTLVCGPALQCLAQAPGNSATTGWRAAKLESPCSRSVVPKLSESALAVLNRAGFTEATVTVHVELLPSGQVGRVSVGTSSGHSELDAVTLKAYDNMKCSFPVPLTNPVTAAQSFTFRTAR